MTDSYDIMCRITGKESAMKVAKDYSNVSPVYFKPELEKCLGRGSQLKRSYKVSGGNK